MTCTEFRRMREEQDPEDLTIAEIAANYRHSLTCTVCREWVLANLSDEELSPEAKAAIWELGNAIVDDPESGLTPKRK